MRRLFFCIILVCCFSCKKYKAQNHFAAAIELEQAEQYHRAITELDTAINLYPEYTEAYINRAIEQSVLGNYPAAIHDISKAIEYAPKWVKLYVVRAEYLRMIDRNQEALTDLNVAIELKFPHYNQVGQIQLLISPEKDDLGYRDAPLSYIYYERASAYYAMDSLQLALDDINYSLENRFNLPNSFYVRSLIFYAYDDRNQACRDLKAAMQHGFEDSDQRLLECCAGWTDRGLIKTFPKE